MLSAGSVKGEFIIDDSQFNEASKRAVGSSKNVEGSFGKMTKSVFTAQAMFALATKALNGLINIGKQSIREFVNQEKAVAQLNATLASTNNAIGMSSEELQKLASSLQDTTTYADDAILGAENLLLTFTKIGKDVFPGATAAVLDMATALNMDFKQAALQVGKILQDPIENINSLSKAGLKFSDSQKEVIKTLVESGNQMEAQKMILTELETKFGGSAVAIRDTFGGSLEALKNINGDVLESFGMLASVVGRDLVEDMISGSKAFRDWITNAENFAVLIDVIEGIFAGLKMPLNAIVKLFQDLAGNSRSLNDEFDPLAATLRVISTGFILTGAAISGIITFIDDLVMGIKNSIKVLGELFNFTKHYQTWQETTDNLKAIDEKGAADRKKLWGDYWNDIQTALKDANETTIKEVNEANNRINYNTKKSATQLAAEAAKRKQEELNAIKEQERQKYQEWTKGIEEREKANQDEAKQQGILEEEKYQEWLKWVNEIEDAKQEQVKKMEAQDLEYFSAFSDIANRAAKAVTDTGNSVADGIGKITNSVFSTMSGLMSGIEEITKKIQDGTLSMAKGVAAGVLESVAAVGQMVADIYNSISEMQMDAMEAELEALQESDAAKLEELTTNKEEQLTQNQEDYDAKLAALDTQLANETITQEQYNLLKADLEKKKKDKDVAVAKEAEDKIAEQKKENRKKENEQKKKIFEAQKANQIANIWIQTAIGVVSAFAGACQWPGVSMIAGLIFAGIMSGILIASAIAQTVIIGQQSFVPEMALGGSLAAGESALVGERGAEIITPKVSSYITPNSISSSILENVGKGQSKSQNISVSFDGAQISNQLELEDVTDYVIMRLGQKLETA